MSAHPAAAISPVTDVSEQPIGPMVAVCCQGAGVLALHALSSGEALGRIPVGGHPVHATRVADRVFVATMDERTVAAVDVGGRVSKINVGVLGPSHFETVGAHLFVTCTAGDVLAAIDPIECELVERIGVGAEPHELAAHNGLLYVGSRRDGVVSVVDAEALGHVHDIPVGDGARVEGVAIAPGSDVGFAVDRANRRVVSFTLGSEGDVVGVADVGAGCYDLTVTADRLYVPSPEGGTIHAYGHDLGGYRVHDGYARPVDLIRWTDDLRVLDRDAPVLRGLEGSRISLPAGAISACETDQGLVLSHYDDASLSVLDATTGVRWHRGTAAYPFGAIAV